MLTKLTNKLQRTIIETLTRYNDDDNDVVTGRLSGGRGVGAAVGAVANEEININPNNKSKQRFIKQ